MAIAQRPYAGHARCLTTTSPCLERGGGRPHPPLRLLAYLASGSGTAICQTPRLTAVHVYAAAKTGPPCVSRPLLSLAYHLQIALRRLVHPIPRAALP